MRISERKRQLREQSSPRTHESAPAAAEGSVRTKVVRPREMRSSARTRSASQKSSSYTKSARPLRKQRGPRFFIGFALVGIILSVILAWSTYSNYNTNKQNYPAALTVYHTKQAQYTTAVAEYRTKQTQYTAALAAYKQALAKHVTPAPVEPKSPVAPTAPTAPVKPELQFTSFILPIVYALLSIVYFYLGYKAAIRERQSATAVSS